MSYPKYGTKLIDRNGFFKEIYFDKFVCDDSWTRVYLSYIFKDGSKWRQDHAYFKPDEYEIRFKEAV